MAVHYDSHSDRVEAIILEGCWDGLVKGGEFLLTETNVVVPLDEATLERSGAVSQDKAAHTIAVSYDTPYAVRQHEELTWKHTPPEKAKYLEETANENEDEILAIVATAGRRAMGGT